MKSIWKFPLDHKIEFEMPKKAVILSVVNINDTPCIFAEVDLENQNNTETRLIAVYQSEDEIPTDQEKVYIGSLFIVDYEIHVFELLN